MHTFIRNDNERYYYIRDALGNILGIINQNGEIVVKYSYTSYGKVTVSYDSTSFNLGNINPFRYKGYYVETENDKEALVYRIPISRKKNWERPYYFKVNKKDLIRFIQK